MARSTATVVLLVGMLAPMWLAGRADAALTDVSITPGTGTIGTTVTVSGSACGPGILVNPSRVTVLGATLGVSIDIAVPASGIWSTQFVVPAGALPIGHAIVVTCARDLVPLPYLPLTFTVEADAPAPTTTLEPAGAVTTTVTSTTVPTTTIANGSNSTTTVAPGAIAPLDPPSDGDDRTAVPTLSREPSDATQSPTSTARESALTTTTHDTTATPGGAAVSASRVVRDDRRRPLVFGALSPIGRGWLGWLVSALLFALILSGALAILWFRWLRHTRAREWWVRWMHQILHIRSHARPPT